MVIGVLSRRARPSRPFADTAGTKGIGEVGEADVPDVHLTVPRGAWVAEPGRRIRRRPSVDRAVQVNSTSADITLTATSIGDGSVGGRAGLG
jgi:hypothetical protein